KDTLHGPTADSTWTISGVGAGTVAGTSFSGFENLTGAADNKDTFHIAPGGVVTGLVDGGPGGFDSVVVDGDRGSVVSNPTDAHSGTLVVDGVPLQYAGMEPITLSGVSDLTVNGDGADNAIDVHPGGAGIEITSPSSESVSFSAARINDLRRLARRHRLRGGPQRSGGHLWRSFDSLPRHEHDRRCRSDGDRARRRRPGHRFRGGHARQHRGGRRRRQHARVHSRARP